MEVRHKRVSRLPAHVPDALDMAKVLADEIHRNIDRYRLRHKNVIKITRHGIYTLLVKKYRLPGGRMTAAYASYVLAYLDHELEKKGYRLIGKIEDGDGHTKVRFYQLPG